MVKINVPMKKQDVSSLRAGDRVLLSGTIYTARDAAYKRLVEAMHKGEELPFSLQGAVVYYVGPTPPPPGKVIGSAGPTTSYRMDAYAPRLLDAGLCGMIGKGDRSDDVVESMVQNKAVYFAAIGGAAALISKCITGAEVVAYEDLASEAVRRLTVHELPLVVAIDCHGNNLYKTGPQRYLESV